MKKQMVTLTLVVTVKRSDIRSAKDALMEALGGDFDAVYSTEERNATPEEIKKFEEEEFPG